MRRLTSGSEAHEDFDFRLHHKQLVVGQNRWRVISKDD